MTRPRRASLLLLLPAAAAALPGSAAARSVPARGYLGVTPHGGLVTLGVSRGAHRLLSFRLRNATGDCMGDPSRISEDGIPLRISARGRFHGGFQGSTALTVTGRLLPGGRARGTFDYFDRGDCGAQGPWRARVERRATDHGPRVFTLAGGRGSFRRRTAPATAANVSATGIAPRPGGGLAVTDDGYSEYAFVRLVSPLGRLTALAGGLAGSAGDGGPAASARLDYPQGIAAEPGGALLVADTGNSCVRRIVPGGTITTVAGVCAVNAATAGFSGDGGPATAAHLDYPAGMAPLPGGGFVIADDGNDRVRRVSAAGVITTLAGIGTPGFSGDGGPGTAAALNGPNDVAVAADGSVLIADEGNGRVRRVAPGGTISTVAGGGTPTLAGGIGDGGPATAAALLEPTGLQTLPGGGFLVADNSLGRIRRVATDGTITTRLGGGPETGEGVPAADADLGRAWKVATTTDGALTWIDGGAVRIAPRAGTRRLLTAIRETNPVVRTGHGRALTFVSTRRARLTVDVTRRHDRVARRRARVRAGVARVRVGALSRGGYHVTITARTGGRIAVASVPLTVLP